MFSWNFANDWMCLPSLMTPQVNLSITYESGVEFQMETNNLPSGLFSDHANFEGFTFPFCRGWLRNVHSFKRHVLSYCSAH